MNEYPTSGGEAVTTITEATRRAGRPGMSLAPPTPEIVAVTETHWPPLALAMLRGALEGFVLGGLDALVALSLDFSARDSLISAGTILFARLAIALGVGGMDQWNAAKERHR